MHNDIWLNLPVKDVNRSKEFFTRLGFSFNAQYGQTDQSACMMVGDKSFVVMLFAEEVFKGFARHDVADARQATQMLLSIGAASPADVDELAKRAWESGGTVFSEPAEVDGWMYACGFADPDGHRWSVLYMDMSKMPNRCVTTA